MKFFAGYEDVTPEEQEAASIKASRLMADLFTAMVGDGADEKVGDDAPTNSEDEDAAVQETSMYLTRLLFLLFGDDAGLWEQDLFYRFVLDHTTPVTLGSQLAALFDVLNTPEQARSKRLPDALARFPYVDSSIFDETMPMQYFSPSMREALINACRRGRCTRGSTFCPSWLACRNLALFCGPLHSPYVPLVGSIRVRMDRLGQEGITVLTSANMKKPLAFADQRFCSLWSIGESNS